MSDGVRGTHHGSSDLDLWIDEKGWAVETVEGETVVAGNLAENGQTRASLTKALESAGYKIAEAPDNE